MDSFGPPPRKQPGQVWAFGPDLAGPDIDRFGGGLDLTWASGRSKMRRTWPDLDVRSTKKKLGLADLDVRSAKKRLGLADLDARSTKIEAGPS